MLKILVSLITLLFFSLPTYAATIYFISPIDNLHATEAPGPFTVVIKDAYAISSFTPATAANDNCGKYYDGSDWQTSSTFSGAMNNFILLALSPTNNYGEIYGHFMGSTPTVGGVITDIERYKEDADDDGICVQDAAVYYKYEGTI